MEIVKLSDIKDASLQNLIEASVGAREKAYPPYSNFPVGAALLCTNSGKVVTGCNVENVSFGLTICAERTAVVKAVSEGHRSFSAVAVSAVGNDFIVTPCGACRQFMSEFNPQLQVYLHNPETGIVGITTLDHLLPQGVLPNNLGVSLFNGKAKAQNNGVEI